MKLNIGCGGDKRIGWENIDREENLFTMKRKSNSVDAILLSHVAMYIRPEEMERLMARWYDWLREDGSIHLETQDLRKIHAPEILYGTGDNAGHRWGWTPETLGKIMEDAGFKEVKSIPGILHGWTERDFLISGKKI